MSIQEMGITTSLSNPADQEKLQKVIMDCSDQLSIIQGHKDVIKENITAICEELDLPKKIVNKMIKTYFNQQFDQECVEHEVFEDLYQKVIKHETN
uniref:Uncharacterized protein n=1 Tax=viral metagenome TaxID=1070528 RepID=A0A6C0JVS4_9ZZZZ